MSSTNDRVTESSPHWTLVVAASLNGVIGRGDELPWRLSSDLKRFKSITMGQCLLMGRKTFQSIGKPLPGRQTIVLSRSQFHCEFPEVAVVDSLEKVGQNVQTGKEVMVVGGAQIYQAALPWCSQIWITRVLAEVEGDTYLPVIDWSQWERTSVEAYPSGEKDQWPTEFEKWQRR
ncbi:MAG: dihydrofolate reductase [Pirellulales bacterium]